MVKMTAATIMARTTRTVTTEMTIAAREFDPSCVVLVVELNEMFE